MKKFKIRTFFVLPLFLTGCALFNPPKEESKVLMSQLSDLKAEIKLQQQEIQGLQMKVRSLQTVPRPKEAAKQPVKKTVKLEKNNKKKTVPQYQPLVEEDSTIADSSHEELHKYFKGVQFLREKKQDEGMNLLKEFIAENPNHVYADRAQMLIADTYLKNKEYGLVIVSTNVLENRYPRSTKLQEALYKRASAFVALDQKEQAKKTLERVLAEFPRNKISELAEKRIATLKTPPLMDMQ